VAGEGAAGVDDRRSMRLGFGAAAVAVVVANDGVEDGAA
jgi:hypothetical protein